MISSISLSNWKSHGSGQFEFKPGTNVIVGRMGAGKSSILQAVTFGLFGTFPELKSRDVKLTELIKKGAEDASITLAFKNYEVVRKINSKGSGDVFLRENDTLLAGPQPTEVNKKIRELLKTDEETFLRTVYAQQNEIDLFLKLSPGDRKKYIDELMNLDKFELARKNCTKTINSIATRVDENRKFIESRDSDLISKTINEVNEELASLASQKKFMAFDAEQAKANEEKLGAQLRDLRNKKSSLDRFKDQLVSARTQISELNNKLKGRVLEGTLSDLENELLLIKNRIAEAQKEKLSLQERKELKESEKVALERKLAVLEEKLNDFEVKKREAEDLRAKLGALRTDLKSEFEAKRTELEMLKETKQKREAETQSIKESIERLESAESICPVCDSKLDSSHKEMLIGKKRTNIYAIEKTINNLERKIAVFGGELQQLESNLEIKKDFERRLGEFSKIASMGTGFSEELDTVSARKISLLSEIEELMSKIKSLDADLNSLSVKYSDLNDKKSLYDAKAKREELASLASTLESQIKALSFDYSVLDAFEKQHTEAIRKVQELKTKAESLDSLMSVQKKRLGELVSDKERLTKIENEIKNLVAEAEFLKKFGNALVKTQEILRKDLIAAVNEVMASIWNELYPYEYWNGVRLLASDSDYKLQLLSDEWVNVAGFASGGERMLACLAMRIAFARVLAPNLSMLILDEPTHNLDQQAIDTFVDVIQNRVAEFLDQLFIITHDEKLAEIGHVLKI